MATTAVAATSGLRSPGRPTAEIRVAMPSASVVKVWRQHRGLTQEDLAKASGVSRPMIAAIETGHKKGGIDTLKKLSRALKIDLDNLA